MSPIAATDAELADAAIKAAWNDPDTSPEVSFEKYFDAHRVRAIVVDGPAVDDLVFLARTGEEVGFDVVWFVQGLDEPLDKVTVAIQLNGIEWDGDRHGVTVRSDDIDFTYYPECIGVVSRYTGNAMPSAFQKYKRSSLILRDENEV